ncbi:hypothetical protein [Haloferula sp. BvORR071]|uniref:hypothetical protein n=1 Tax=Haloferula sp. BvORR071 TaxID=1396141 RepID=UPI00224104B1|nr:hypothetical protein [Haloferula sp. BvORR071]
MKLALHRSLSFWSGLLVISFILFIWWASQFAMVSAEAGSVKAINWCGGVSLIHNAVPSPHPAYRVNSYNRNWPRVLPAPFFIRGKEIKDPVDSWNSFGTSSSLPEWLESAYANQPRSQWMLFIPHWMILPAAALPWIGLIAWRARRRRAELNPPLILT